MDKTLNRRDFNKLVSTALGGMVAGTFIGCGRSQEGESKMSTDKLKDITLRHYGPSYSAIGEALERVHCSMNHRVKESQRDA